MFETNKEASVNYVCGFIVLGIFDFLFGLFVLMDKCLCIWVKIIGKVLWYSLGVRFLGIMTRF